ncbi:MAG: FAD-binding protein [Chloroflexi bacterium]|nr:FAD-binding protein [Chloroflexota bacterium]
MDYISGLEWPYPVQYGKETDINVDVLVLGGGISGCWAALTAARQGMKVAILEKGATIRSGAGGSGCDHWGPCPTNPCSDTSPEEVVEQGIKAVGGYSHAISHYISARESYDTLLELEQIGGKVRDTDDEFKGADFRDEKTKFLFAYDYDSRYRLRVWGTTFKPSLYRECQSLGVQIYDRTMATSLLTEGGKQGARVIGATGMNVRTGEMLVIRSKATILCMSKHAKNWTFSTELTGLNGFRPNLDGSGYAMAWRAGAAFMLMEMSKRSMVSSGTTYPFYGTGNPFNTWVPCTIVDAKGKEIPWMGRDGNILKSVSERTHYSNQPPGRQRKVINDIVDLIKADAEGYHQRPPPDLIPDIEDRIKRGEYTLPLYADLPGMPEMERKAIWGLMVGNEGRTKVPVYRTYMESGFDPKKDLLQSYIMLGGQGLFEQALPHNRLGGELGAGGGPVVDWDLMTTLEGLFAAGDTLPTAHTHCHAASTGRYAGRKATEYANKVAEGLVSQEQIKLEKARIYAPVKRDSGIDWKELNAGLCRVMQNYCGAWKNEELLNIGLNWLDDIERNVIPTAYAANPHILQRMLGVFDILTCDKIIVNSSKARKASSAPLSFIRLDHPQVDPPEWQKWVTVKQTNGVVTEGSLPIGYHGDIVTNYEKHCGL